jgi:hypothetical protein
LKVKQIGGIFMTVKDKRGAQFFWVENALIDEWSPKLGATAIAVYIVLARHAGTGPQYWMNHKSLARALGIYEFSVERAIETLEGAGLIEVVSRYATSAGHRGALQYILNPVPPLVKGEDDDDE